LDDSTLVIFNLGCVGFDLDLGLFHSDDFGDGFGVNLLGFSIHLLDLHIFFDDGHLFSGILKFDETGFVTFFRLFKLFSLATEHSSV